MTQVEKAYEVKLQVIKAQVAILENALKSNFVKSGSVGWGDVGDLSFIEMKLAEVIKAVKGES